MTHRSDAGRRTTKRVVTSLVASALLIVGSPVLTTADASRAGGAHKSVDWTHGACKTDNASVHKGFNCPWREGE